MLCFHFLETHHGNIPLLAASYRISQSLDRFVYYATALPKSKVFAMARVFGIA